MATNADSIGDKERVTVLLALYKENADQSRHHEMQRERVTALVGQASGVVLGLLSAKAGIDALGRGVSIGVPIFLIILGLWGFFASSRHYERSRLHVQRLRQARKEIEDLTSVPLRDMNRRADLAHEQSFDPDSWRYRRTHAIWNAFHLIVALVGLVLLFLLSPVQCCR